jgi:hypothetical protein
MTTTLQVSTPGETIIQPTDGAAVALAAIGQAVTVLEVGRAGPQGPPGIGVAPYVHTQASAAVEWIVNHNLGYRPAVELSDTAGNGVGAQILHISDNQLRVYFNQPAAGFARCL